MMRTLEVSQVAYYRLGTNTLWLWPREVLARVMQCGQIFSIFETRSQFPHSNVGFGCEKKGVKAITAR